MVKLANDFSAKNISMRGRFEDCTFKQNNNIKHNDFIEKKNYVSTVNILNFFWKGQWTFLCIRFSWQLVIGPSRLPDLAQDFSLWSKWPTILQQTLQEQKTREKKDQIFLVNNIGYNVLRCTMVNFLKMSIILNSNILKVI